MSKYWLWLEDDSFSIFDIESILESESSGNIEIFDSITDLQNFLIKNRKNLQRYGLIIDIMMAGEFKIYIPKEWCREKETISYDTHKGDKAGLIFVKEFVLCKDNQGYIWKPPPPIIFLSVLKEENDVIDELEKIKNKWKNAYKEATNKDIEIPKVKFINKWEFKNYLINTIKNFNG